MVLLSGCSLEGSNSYAGKIVCMGKRQESKPNRYGRATAQGGAVMGWEL